MTAEALIDIPAIPKINELESVNTRRHSTGKVIVPNGGVTVISRYLKTSQGSCHDLCKYGARCNLETESKSPRIPMPKTVTPKRSAGQTLERTESNLGERRKKSEVSLKLSPYFTTQEPDDPIVIKIAQRQGGHHVENVESKLIDTKKSEVSLKPSADTEPQKPDYPVVSLKLSADLVDIKTLAAEGEGQDEENGETKLSEGEKKPDVSLKPSPDSKSQKPVDPDCIGREVSSGTNKEAVSPKQVSLPVKETDVAVAHARDSKLKPQSKPSSVLKQKCSIGKQKIEGRKSKGTNAMSMTPLGVSSGRNNGDMTISDGMRTSAMGEKKNIVPASPSLSPKESSTSVSRVNAKKQKSRGVYRPKQENAKKIKPEKSCGKDAKWSKNLKGVSHLTDQENVKKPNSEQASFAVIPEKTLYIMESNLENKPAESSQSSVHVSDLSTMPSLSSKDKSTKQTRNRIPIGQSTQLYSSEKKNMKYRPKGIHAPGLPPSLSSFPGKKGLRSTLYGLNVTQRSLTSSLPLVSAKSSHNDASSEHDEVAAQKQTSSSRMMYKGRPKRALITTSKNKGEKLNFQRGKVTQVPLQDCTPRRLAFRQRVLVDSRNDDSQKGKIEDCTPRRLKFRQRVLVDNRNGDNQNGRGEKITPRRLKFRQRVLVDNRNGDNQNVRSEEITPRRLKFRRRVLVDDRNADNQNGRGEDYTPRKLKFRRTVLDVNKNGNIQNSEGDTSKKNSEGKEADVGHDNATEVQSDKISLRHNDVKEKKDSGGLYNNMIEETANRLVRTKSSKVKALVSAFESVISLLDTGFSETNNTH